MKNPRRMAFGMLVAIGLFGSRPAGSQAAAHPSNSVRADVRAPIVADPIREEAVLAKRAGTTPHRPSFSSKRASRNSPEPQAYL
jgi:hypothetical protein